MKIHSVIKKGEDHVVFCEDFMVMNDHGRFFVGAVFDGCSGGNDSHFASSLFGKVFNQIFKNGSLSGETLEAKARDFTRKFVNKLFDIKVSLQLEENDMLATFVVLIYDKVHGEALTMTVGDGVVHCDGEIFEFKNERFKFSHPTQYMDMPDYISYDLVELGFDGSYFDAWYDKHVKVKKFIDPKDICISTDGILSFKKPEEPIDVIDFLMKDSQWCDNKIMLSKKINVLRTRFKTIHKDDISIIRLVFNSEENDKSNNEDGNN